MLVALCSCRVCQGGPHHLCTLALVCVQPCDGALLWLGGFWMELIRQGHSVRGGVSQGYTVPATSEASWVLHTLDSDHRDINTRCHPAVPGGGR